MCCPRLRFRPRRFFILLCASTLLVTVRLGNFSRQMHFTAYVVEPAEQSEMGVGY